MKQIHLNILLPIALLVALAAAAAVFVIPMPFLGAPDPKPIASGPGASEQPPQGAGANLPVIEPQDWNPLAAALDAARIPAAGGHLAVEPEPEPEPEEDEEDRGARAMLNGLQWAYVGNIVEPERIVACVEMEGKQSWLVEGQTTSATAGLGPFDVNIKSISEKEIVIEYKEATRTFPIQTEATASTDFDIAT